MAPATAKLTIKSQCGEVISMRLKSVVIFFAGMCLFAAANQVLAASPEDRCALPPSLLDEISKTYHSVSPVSQVRTSKSLICAKLRTGDRVCELEWFLLSQSYFTLFAL